MQQLTITELIAITGRTRQAIEKRAGLDAFVVGVRHTATGRPATLYSPECLKLWGMDHAVEVPLDDAGRKVRADEGRPRKCTPAEWDRIVQRVKGLYFASAQANLKLACEHAAHELAAEGIPVGFNLYAKLWQRRRSRTTGNYLSPYRQEKWDVARQKHWQKLDRNLQLPMRHHEYHQLLESMGIAGAGFGAHAIWAIDGHKSDAWARIAGQRERGREKGAMVYWLVIRDGISQMPLLVKPIETETSDAICTALVECAMRWGTGPLAAVAVDGGIAKAVKNMGVLASLLPAEAWELAARFPNFYGQDPEGNSSPILINRPYQPTAPVKALLERGFKQFKDEFDAPRFAPTYQGGNRLEAVQMRISTDVTITSRTPTAEEYIEQFQQWCHSDYINRPRPDQFPTMVERGLAPTIANTFAHYGGYRFADASTVVEGERIAYLLYWFSPNKRVVTCRHPNRVETTINGQWWPIACAELSYRYVGEKIAVIPLPNDTRHCILLEATNSKRPRYIGIGHNTYVENYGRLEEITPIVQQVQRTALKQLREAVPPLRQWRNTTAPPAPLTTLVGGATLVGGPTLMGGAAQALPPPGPPPTDPTAAAPAAAAAAAAPPPVIDTDTADFLDDLEGLLNT